MAKNRRGARNGATGGNEVQAGVVKTWKTGYGFLDWNGISLYVHHTAVHATSKSKSLQVGSRVEFTIEKGEKGLLAGNVTGPQGSYCQLASRPISGSQDAVLWLLPDVVDDIHPGKSREEKVKFLASFVLQKHRETSEPTTLSVIESCSLMDEVKDWTVCDQHPFYLIGNVNPDLREKLCGVHDFVRQMNFRMLMVPVVSKRKQQQAILWQLFLEIAPLEDLKLVFLQHEDRWVQKVKGILRVLMPDGEQRFVLLRKVWRDSHGKIHDALTLPGGKVERSSDDANQTIFSELLREIHEELDAFFSFTIRNISKTTVRHRELTKKQGRKGTCAYMFVDIQVDIQDTWTHSDRHIVVPHVMSDEDLQLYLSSSPQMWRNFHNEIKKPFPSEHVSAHLVARDAFVGSLSNPKEKAVVRKVLVANGAATAQRG